MEEYKEYPIYKGFHDAIEYFIYILIYVHIMKYDLDEIMAVAVKTALKSPCKYKISCILVDDNGKIVATGFNHFALNGRRMGKPTVHAESDALNKIMKPSNNITAFIYRKNSRNINPCPACKSLLKAYGVKRVFCTSDKGWFTEDM